MITCIRNQTATTAVSYTHLDVYKRQTKTSELASATKIDLVKKELVTFADNYKEVDFGWED